MHSRRTIFFITLFSILALAIVTLTLHSVLAKPDTKTIRTISAITKLPPPALCAHYLEPRIRVYRDYRDHIYPKMRPIDYLGFVYAK